MRLKPRYGDILIIVLLMISIVLIPKIFSNGVQEMVTAVIEQDGHELGRIRLTGFKGPQRVDFSGTASGRIVAADGKIHFEKSSCPDQTCVHTGWVSKAGQIAACLPARVIIRLEGTSDITDEDIRLH
jgi:hypothetical protein